ncbi:hypothetical protein, partial [Glutamicibacter ardleyensis]|uniref:hypothetical protein n=1 Tax=Glutamicibacter ardleyensis TaxID=225894 RepID=UPI003FCEE778
MDGITQASNYNQKGKIRQPTIEIGSKYEWRKYTPVADRDISFYSYLCFDYFYNQKDNFRCKKKE